MKLASFQHIGLHSCLWLLSLAPASARSAVLPEGFPATPQNRSETVIYTRTSGEVRSTVHRPTIEAICTANPEGKTPVFEPGFDEPVRMLSHSYVSLSGDKRATYARIDSYNCDEAEIKSRGVCGCTYRKQSERKIEVQVQSGRGRDSWTAWPDRGTGKHQLRAGPGRAQLAPPPRAMQDSLLGPVVAIQMVAGLKCELRRKTTETIRSELCRALPDAALPAPVRTQALSSESSLIEKVRLVPYSRLTTEQLDLAAQVDAGVFSMPGGVQYQEGR